MRPALTNLGRRKPCGLVVTYGERTRAGEATIEGGAELTVLGAPVAVIFRHIGRGFSEDWKLRTQPRSSFWRMVANGLGRSTDDDRSISEFVVKHRIMLPAPLVARVTSVSDRAGRSR